MKYKFSFDIQVVFQFFMAVGLIVLSMAFYFKETHPNVIIYDVDKELVGVYQSNRQEGLNTLMRGSLLQVARMATASWPYDPAGLDSNYGTFDIKKAILAEWYSDEVEAIVLSTRNKLLSRTMGINWVPKTYYQSDPVRSVYIKRMEGVVRMEGYFTQEIVKNNKRVLLKWLLRAEAMIMPITEHNPYGLKFTKLHIRALDNQISM